MAREIEAKTARIIGIVLAIVGAALAVYSFPFVTWVAFGFFLLGLVGFAGGLWLTVSRGKPTT